MSAPVQKRKMPKKMLIDATHAEETRVVVVDGNKVEEFDFESENKRQLAGNIYLAKVTRVEPSLQAAFVDYGGNRHGFLAFSEIHPDYYQIPVADREALLAEERAYAKAQAAREEEDAHPKRRTRSRSRTAQAEGAMSADAVTSGDIEGMETVDFDEIDVPEDEASSPMERVKDTPVETPDTGEGARADHDHDHNADHDADDDEDDVSYTASDKDESIESVAEEDDSDDFRSARKPRARRYKIQEVVKVRQILLVQVVKEERGNKGAALTTYLSLAGRYCVLMPNTARGGGISRKITNAVDRKKLKEIAQEIEVPQGAGLIVRTAGAKRTKAEIKRDYEYLQRMWEEIRSLTLRSIAPAKIYEEGDLIKRTIRDLYNRDIDEVFVEGERGYRIAKDFMKMIMPSHAKNVKRYEENLPLFARYQVEAYLAGMFNPTVQLPSGGYIVIGVTEALVAVDVNSGRATKEGSIEQTALKTNLEAAAEVARQVRLRDLAGLIVIDFIDMDERKNNASVEKMMKDKLKTDRARIQIGRISGFGLMEMSRQRLRPGMIEATTQPCQACHGTGLIRSDDNLALAILRSIEEEGTRRRSREVLVKAPVGIVNFLMNQKREHIAHIEARYGLSVRVEGDPHLVSPDFSIEKFKTATRVVQQIAHIVSADTSLMDQIDEADAARADAAEAADITHEAAQEEAQISADTVPAAAAAAGSSGADTTTTSPDDGEDKPKRKRRRRRRSRGGRASSDENGDDEATAEENGDDEATGDGVTTDVDALREPDAPEQTQDAQPDAGAETAKPKSRSRSRSRKPKEAPVADQQEGAPEAVADGGSDAGSEVEKPKAKRTRAPRKPKVAAADAASEADGQARQETVAEQGDDPASGAKPKAKSTRKPKAAPKAKAEAEIETLPDAVSDAVSEPASEPQPEVKATPDVVTQEPPVAEPQAQIETVPEAEVEAEVEAETKAQEPAKPRRKGWWSLGGS
jgi:ribonuclease E